MISRRDFLKMSMAAGAALALPKGWLHTVGSNSASNSIAYAAAGTPALTKFVDRLVHPIPKLSAIDNPSFPGADYYEISMSPGAWKFHSQLGTARTFCYGGMP